VYQRDGTGSRSWLQQGVVDGQYVVQFVRWIKQHLRIKAFYGTAENAVKTQIWIAVSVYVLVAIVRKRLGLEATLYQILQVLSITPFEKTPILRALQACDSQTICPPRQPTDSIRLLTGQPWGKLMKSESW
jgi:hypothetical protein